MTLPRPPFHIDARDTNGGADELAIQAQFRGKMRIDAPQVMLVAVPNAGKRSAWEKRQRAKEGLTPGFPDMIALYDGKTAMLEFKSGIGSLSPAQTDCLNRLVRLGFPVGVFRRADTALDWMRGHFPSAFLSEAA